MGVLVQAVFHLLIEPQVLVCVHEPLVLLHLHLVLLGVVVHISCQAVLALLLCLVGGTVQHEGHELDLGRQLALGLLDHWL